MCGGENRRLGRSRKEAGKGRLDSRSQHWPDSKGGGGVGRRGEVREKRGRIQIQQYGYTHQIRLGLRGSRAKHEGEAILLAESESP